MFTIFLGLTPFIFITFLGFVFGKLKVLDLSHAKILNLFLFYIAVPALIIKLIAQNEIGQVDFKQIFSYLIMQSICGIIAYLITSKYFKRSIPESIIWALTVALSNHVTLLLPITEIYFQQNVITQVASIILMDGIILLSVIAFFLELSTKKNVNLFNFIKNLFLKKKQYCISKFLYRAHHIIKEEYCKNKEIHSNYDTISLEKKIFIKTSLAVKICKFELALFAQSNASSMQIMRVPTYIICIAE